MSVKSLIVSIVCVAVTLGGGIKEAAAMLDINTWTTTTGARVMFVAAPDLPMVDVRVTLAAGSARDGEQPGLASLTANLLTEGAGEWSADEIAERLDAVGAKISTGVDRDMAWVTLRSLVEEPALNTALETLAAIVAQPRFSTADVERVRRNRLVALTRSEQQPGTVARKALYHMIFADHPYAHDPSGNIESVGAMQPEDLRQFHQRHYQAANAVISLVGALTRPQAEALVEQLSAEWTPGTPAPPISAVTPLAQGEVQRIDFPSSQTHVLVGAPGMRRNDPDYFPLYVGNHILGGGGLVSLLMESVREQRGLSYSVYSYFLPLAEDGPFILGLQTQNAQADAALAVLLDTLAQFIDQGPTEAQLAAAVDNITGGFPLRIASNSKIGHYLAVMGFYDLPLDHLERFNERVRAVTAEQIHDAFRRRVDLQRLHQVLVGRGE